MKNEPFKLYSDGCLAISNALADVICWFDGFEAAHAMTDKRLNLPQGIERLRDLNIKLKEHY